MESAPNEPLPPNPPEVYDVSSSSLVEFEDHGITNFSPGYHAAEPKCYTLIAADGTEVLALSEKGPLVLENTINKKIEIYLALIPLAHSQHFPQITLIFESLAQLAAFMTNERMIRNELPEMCLRPAPVHLGPLGPLGPLGHPGLLAPPQIQRNSTVSINGTLYVSVLGKYFFKDRYGSRSKDSLLVDAANPIPRAATLRVYTVNDYMPIATERTSNRRQHAIANWLKSHRNPSRRKQKSSRKKSRR